MTEKPLGKITAILADLGLEVTYAYDDLVFVQHSAFMIQFTDVPEKLKMFINTECEPETADSVAANVVTAFEKEGFDLILTGRYFLTPNEDETLNIEFEKQSA
jgi:hypothetical protein